MLNVVVLAIPLAFLIRLWGDSGLYLRRLFALAGDAIGGYHCHGEREASSLLVEPLHDANKGCPGWLGRAHRPG